MPPRYAYWTILIDDEPTAFRAGAQEDLMPTFKRLQEKHPSAKMMWFQNGKLWNSRIDAQEAMRVRGEIGRRRGARQEGGFRDRRPRIDRPERPEWKPKGTGKLEWQPKGVERKPARTARPEWKPREEGSKASRPQRSSRPPASAKLEWKPKGEGTRGSRPADPGSREKRKWVPKEEYKKSKGIEARRDKNWRPGGEHKDPRQKYKDAKKAKWGRFKQTIRKRWETKKKGDK